MAGLNKVAGYLGADPESRPAGNGYEHRGHREVSTWVETSRPAFGDGVRPGQGFIQSWSRERI